MNIPITTETTTTQYLMQSLCTSLTPGAKVKVLEVVLILVVGEGGREGGREGEREGGREGGGREGREGRQRKGREGRQRKGREGRQRKGRQRKVETEGGRGDRGRGRE